MTPTREAGARGAKGAESAAAQGLRAGALLLALTLFFYVDKLILGPFAAVRVHDVFDTDYSRYREYGKLLLKHGVYQWFPNYVGGMPSYVWQHPPYFILCPLAAILPLWLMYGVLIIGFMAAAAWGMYRLLRERMALPEAHAIAWAAVYALSTQIQPDGVPESVFSFASPLFYVWAADVWEGRAHSARVVRPLLGLLLLIALSYPVITLPHFALLHFGYLALDRKLDGRMRERISLAAWSCVLWLGYVLVNAPLLYALLEYAPQAARHFETPKTFGVGMFSSFLDALARVWGSAGARSLVAAPALAGLVFVRPGSWLARCFLVWGAVWACSGFFGSDLYALFNGTLLQKMDLNKFYWLLPPATALVAAAAYEEAVRRRELRGRYLWATAAALAASVWFMRNESDAKALVLVDLAAALIIGVTLKSGAQGDSALGSGGRRWAGLAAAVAIGALIPLFRPHPHSIPVYAAAVLAAWVLWRRWPEGSTAGDVEQRRALVFAAAALVLVVSVRLFRFQGDESEDRPFIRLMRYEALGDLAKAQAEPVRAGSSGDHLTSEVLNRYGWETIEGRGSIMSGRMKSLFKLIVKPQFIEPGREQRFDWYWYTLYLRQTQTPRYNMALLALTNTKYLFSVEDLEVLRGQVEEVAKLPSDLTTLCEKWGNRAARIHPAFGRAVKRLHRSDYVFRYTVPGAFPRAFLVGGARVLADDASVLSSLGSASISDLRGSALVSAADGPETRALERLQSPGPAGEDPKIERYAPDHIVYMARPVKPALFVVSNNFHEHWRAKVDGKPAPLVRADHAFQAVALEPGEHRVVLEYRDPHLASVHLGLLAGLGLILSPLALGAAGSRKRRG